MIDVQKLIFNQFYDEDIRQRIAAFAATHSQASQSAGLIVPQSGDGRAELLNNAMGQLREDVLNLAMDSKLPLQLPIVLRVFEVTEETRKQSGKKIIAPSFKLRLLLGDGSLSAIKAEVSVELRGHFDTILPGSYIKITHCVPMKFRLGSENGEANETEAPQEWSQLWFSIHGFELVYSPTVSGSKAFSHAVTSDQNLRHSFVTSKFVRKMVMDIAVQSINVEQDAGSSTIESTKVAIDVVMRVRNGQVHDDTTTSSNVASLSDQSATAHERTSGGGETPPDDEDDDDTDSTSSNDDEDDPPSYDDDTELRLEEKLVDCDGSLCGDPETVSFRNCLMKLRPVLSVNIRAIRKATFFAQNNLDKDLANSLIRNVLYYFFYTTYLQLARERSGKVDVGERSKLPPCVVAAIRHYYPNEINEEYVGFIAHSTEPWW